MSRSRTGPVPESAGPVMLVVKWLAELDEPYPLCLLDTETGGAPNPVAGPLDADVLG